MTPRIYAAASTAVVPAKAGIHFDFGGRSKMDPGLRRDDGNPGLRRDDGLEGVREIPMTKHATNG
jgi:hypothetical protein